MAINTLITPQFQLPRAAKTEPKRRPDPLGQSPFCFRYRPDIDALRGIAVLAVIVYHLNESWLPGGFVGVDIFFAISGYVVMGSLLSRRVESLGDFLSGFYARRIKRLLPNLLCMVLLTALGVAVIVPPDQSRAIFTSAVKALYGWSNNYFFFKADNYFAIDTAYNPFAHTWSLGVEEQFYLVFPFLLLLFGFVRGRNVFFPLLGFAIASLILSAVTSAQAPMAAFFLMPCRFWEMAAGSLLVLAQARGWFSSFAHNPSLRRLRVLLGFGLIGWSLMTTSAYQGFPFPGCLPAIAGTCLVIEGLSAADLFRLPAPATHLSKGLVFCGVLSYSLYLWHWPVITFLRWTVGFDHPWTYAVAVVLIAGLALLAFGLLEKPLRHLSLPRYGQFIAGLFGIAASWLLVEQLGEHRRGDYYLGRHADKVFRQEEIGGRRPVIAGTGIDGAACGIAPWHPYSDAVATDFNSCSKPPRSIDAREIFLLGDSHAHHLLPMLDEATNQVGSGITFTFKANCLISSELTINYKRRLYEPCREFAAGEIDRAIERLKPGDVVMISTWLNRQLGDIHANGLVNDFPIFHQGQAISLSQAREIYVREMRQLAHRLSRSGLELLLVVDVPSLARHPLACEAWSDVWPGLDSLKRCSPDPSVTRAMQQQVQMMLAAIAEDQPNVHVFDPTDQLLEGSDWLLHKSADGTLKYVDKHHIGYSASYALGPSFREFLQRRGLASPYRDPLVR